MFNTQKLIGAPNQNLVLVTAGRVYVKVEDRYYELDFRNEKVSSVNEKTQIPDNTEQVEVPEIDLSGYVTKDELEIILFDYDFNKAIKNLQVLIEKIQQSITYLEERIENLYYSDPSTDDSNNVQLFFLPKFTLDQCTFIYKENPIDASNCDYLGVKSTEITHPYLLQRETGILSVNPDDYAKWTVNKFESEIEECPYIDTFVDPDDGSSSTINGYVIEPGIYYLYIVVEANNAKYLLSKEIYDELVENKYYFICGVVYRESYDDCIKYINYERYAIPFIKKFLGTKDISIDLENDEVIFGDKLSYKEGYLELADYLKSVDFENWKNTEFANLKSAFESFKSTVETFMSTTNTKITNIQNNITEIQDNITSIRTTVNNHGNRITNLETRVGNLEAGEGGEGGGGEVVPIPGPAGVGIASVTQTVTSTASGGRNTIKVTLTDGTVSYFYVYNGAEGQPGADGINGKDGISITDIQQTAIGSGSNAINTIEITLSNGDTKFFNVANGDKGDDGISITDITTAQSLEDGGENIITITLSDGTSKSFTVRNGSKGSSGSSGEGSTIDGYTKDEIDSKLSDITNNLDSIKEDIYTKSETDKKISDAIKNQKFKTVQENSILGTGNITIIEKIELNFSNTEFKITGIKLHNEAKDVYTNLTSGIPPYLIIKIGSGANALTYFRIPNMKIDSKRTNIFKGTPLMVSTEISYNGSKYWVVFEIYSDGSIVVFDQSSLGDDVSEPDTSGGGGTNLGDITVEKPKNPNPDSGIEDGETVEPDPGGGLDKN